MLAEPVCKSQPIQASHCAVTNQATGLPKSASHSITGHKDKRITCEVESEDKMGGPGVMTYDPPPSMGAMNEEDAEDDVLVMDHSDFPVHAALLE